MKDRVKVEGEKGRYGEAVLNEDGSVSLIVNERSPIREGVAVVTLDAYAARWFGLHLAGLGADSLRAQRSAKKKP